MSTKSILKTIEIHKTQKFATTINYTHLDASDLTVECDLPRPSELEVEEVIGKGGMGIVYLANQSHPDRKVAIKRLYNNNLVLRWALYQEAMITGALDHPTIIPVHTLNLEGPNAPEVIMKRVQGETMLHHLSQHPLSESQFRKMLVALIQVCNGLDYAHTKNIFHRDVKPENIMIGAFGEVYLMDWGVAVKQGEVLSLPLGLVGTPAYMAPEMLSGDPSVVDARTDVYLLGATLHHLLTGEYKHDGDELSQVLDSVQVSAPYSYDDSHPDMLADLANEACHPDPEKRPQSAGAFRRRLQEFLEYNQAYGISGAANEELEALKQLTTIERPSKTDRYAIHRHFNRSRFGFEQALDIWPAYEEARQLLEDSICCMARHYLSRQQLEAAQQLLDELETIPSDLSAELQSQITAQQDLQEQFEHLKSTVASSSSSNTVFRGALTVGVVGACGIFLYILFQIDDLNPNAITPTTLFTQSVLISLPLFPLLLFGRNTMLVNPNGRRAALGVSGAVVAMVLHRWIAMTHNELPASIIVVDLFIVGLGLLNTTPAIRYGRWLGLMCFTVGVINHLFPITFWLGSLLVGITIGLSVLGDWKRNWNLSESKPKLSDRS